MGPLVPNIISPEFNFIIALLIGIAFGFVLEQAGFSSSRKLAGVFYGYDFTVLRVFFTAAITAMSGIIILGYIGWLDLELIYINPTFLGSAIVGGIIMGAGFITGGFCPGTSVTAAAIGKLDAWVFLGGILIGALIFGEIYPNVKDFYLGGALGDIKVFDSLGISRGFFAFGLIIIALSAFVVTAFIEANIHKKEVVPNKELRNSYVMAISIALVFGIIAFVLPDRKQKLIEFATDQENLKEENFDFVEMDFLAIKLIDQDPNTQIIDIRSMEQYNEFSLPNSINIPFKMLPNREWKKVLDNNKDKVFISESVDTAKSAVLMAGRLGYKNNFALEVTIKKFKEAFVDLTEKSVSDSEEDFRLEAGQKINQMIEENKNKKQPVVVKRKRVAGGC